MRVARRRHHPDGAPVEGVVHRDDLVRAIAVQLGVLARQLHRAFEGLDPRVAEEHSVGEGVGRQPLGQALLARNAEQVRGMPKRLGLRLQGGDQVRMAVPERGYGDAG